MHVLELDENKRIMTSYEALPKGIERGTYEGKTLVNEIPEGDVTDYKYVKGEYVYDPLPEPEPIEPEPTSDEILNALLGVE